MSIEKMMCLSTGHVTQATAAALDQQLNANANPDAYLETEEWADKLCLYPHGEYGWLICITGPVSEDEEFREQAPEDLMDCITHADDNGCYWLLLDRDADLIDEIPSYEW